MCTCISIRYRCAGTSSFIVSKYDPASVPSCTDWLWQQKQLNETVSFSLDWSSSIGPQHNAARVALGRRSAPLLLIDQYLPPCRIPSTGYLRDRQTGRRTDGQTPYRYIDTRRKAGCCNNCRICSFNLTCSLYYIQLYFTIVHGSLTRNKWINSANRN